MNTENIVKNLRVLWRTDRIIADIRMRHMLIGLGLRAFAALIAAFGLLMLELSAYFALVQIWSAIFAAAILGGVNFAIAAILFMIAGQAARRARTRTGDRNSRLRRRCAANRGAGGAVAVLRHDPSSPEQRVADAAGAADHDHRQKPEEAEGSRSHRGQGRRGIKLMTAGASGPASKQGAYQHAEHPTQADPEHVAAAAVSANPHRACREPDHPEGDASVAYIIVAPLDADGRIDQNYGGRIATPAGSRGVARTRRTNMVISSTIRAVPGVFTMTATSSCPRTSATISQTNIS